MERIHKIAKILHISVIECVMFLTGCVMFLTGCVRVRGGENPQDS